MDVNYEKLQTLYTKYFSLNFLGTDINNKFALISLTCHITNKIKNKIPNWNHFKTLNKINEGLVPEEILKGLAIVCTDFSYGCKLFPTFGIPDKNIPDKIKELLKIYVPF